MKIHIQSNFVVPGVGKEETIDFDCQGLTLRHFFEGLSKMSRRPIKYVQPGAKALDPDDWEVEVNWIPYQDLPEGLETQLKEGDTVTLKILAFGGG
jgi:hypothetical protein